VGLAPWQERERIAPDGGVLRVMATPARHGPAHADRGPVIGFALTFRDEPESTVYVSGDTVWYDGVREVSERCAVRVAILFLGAARVRAVGEWHVTFTAAEAVEAARAFSLAVIVPVHFEGWEHLSESRAKIEQAFRAAGLEHRLRWLTPGDALEVLATS
jgi:L-ascorbate metabolism protein UlaG (beta-lactamase superfamily)